jgi:hypothetical protein
MQQSPDWAASPALQDAAKGWNADADAIEANAKVIAALKDQLKAADSKQRSLRRDWRTSTKHVLSTAGVVCGGSVDRVKALGLDVITQTKVGALDAPTDLVVQAGKALGQTVSAWLKGNARHGFLVQHATDPANPATYSAVTPSTKTKYTLDGSPSGANVYVRVAAVDPTSKSGMSPWTPWTAGTAR